MFLIELIGDAIIDAWFAVMQWIVPQKMMGKCTRIILKIIAGIFTCLLFASLIIGFFAIISEDPDTHLLGEYMVYIPLGISTVQIFLGMIVRFVEKRRNKK